MLFRSVIAFCAIMLHVTRMVFGVGGDGTAHATPLSCKATLVLAAVPLIVIGIYLPMPLQALLRTAAAALGG